MLNYSPNPQRYSQFPYRFCGNSGLKLPPISLGLWQNFGEADPIERQKEVLTFAFDAGITHFDLANNYGPPADAAEMNFGRIFKENFHPYRHEIVVSTKAGYLGWGGPYGEGGSRKYLISSLERSLRHLQLDYVDIFYHHCPDPKTPLEETMGALDHLVRQGKALYVGLSNYSGEQMKKAVAILRSLGTPCLIHQPVYNMLNRNLETDLLPALREEKIGCIPFSPLAQGLLTNRYLNGIPQDSRIGRGSVFLKEDRITPEMLSKITKLNDLAQKRDQSLAQMALAWILRLPEITSVLVGASSVNQLQQNLGCIKNLSFTAEEFKQIDQILGS
ncbi:MAG: aldo/keto reductase [Verrucomicrobiota bacterium]